MKNLDDIEREHGFWAALSCMWCGVFLIVIGGGFLIVMAIVKLGPLALLVPIVAFFLYGPVKIGVSLLVRRSKKG